MNDCIKYICVILFTLTLSEVIGQQDCYNFNDSNGIPYCQCYECGEGLDELDASWETVSSNSICEGDPFILTGANSSPASIIEDYHWYFLDAVTSDVFYYEVNTTPEVTYTYELNSALPPPCNINTIDVTVVLIITTESCPEGEGCVRTVEDLQILLKPRADFDAEQEVCVGDQVTFTNESCYADSYFWTFENGQTSTNVDETYTFLTPGEYEVTLTASNGCGDDTKVKTIKVIGEPIAEVGVQYDPETGCKPLEVFFENQSQNILGNAIFSYEWTVYPINGNGWQYLNEIIGNDTTIYNANTWDTQVLFTDTGTYIIELLVENVCGPTTWIDTVQVFETPDVSLNSPGFQCLDNGSIEVVFDNSLVTYSGTNQGVEWEGFNQDGDIIFTSSLNNPSVVFTQSGTYTVGVTLDGGPCGEDTESITFTVQAPGQVDLSSNPNTICNTDATIQLNPAGSTWSGSPYVSSTGILNPANASGTLTLTYTPPDDCITPGAMMITVLQGPEVEIEDIPVACDEIITDHVTLLSGTFGDVTWEHILPDGTIIESIIQDAPPVFTYSGAGEHLFVVTLSDEGCGSVSDTSIVEIQSLDAIVIEPLPTPLCSTSSPDTIEVTPTGGSWSGTGVTSDGIFDPSVPPTGVPVTLTYTYGEGVCTSIESIDVVITASAPVSVETDLTICVDSDPYSITYDPLGGTWTGTGVSVDGVFDSNGLTPGIYEVTYLYGDANGCEITQTSMITIEALPTIEMDDAITFCETSDNIDLPANLVNYSLNPAAGTVTWSGPGIIDPVLGSFNSLQAGANGIGTYTVYVNYMLIDCEVQDSIEIEIVPVQFANAGLDDTLCISDQFYTLTGSPVGGQWQEVGGQGNGLNTSTGEINLELAGGGIHNYAYTFAAGTSCEVEDEVIIEIIDLSGVDAGADFEVCEGTASFQLSGSSPGGGEWSGPGIINPEGGFDPGLLAPDSTYTLTYCIEDETVVCSACDESTVTINALPVSDFQINGTNCVGEELVIENLSLNACSYLWDFGDPASGANNTSTLEAPTHIYNTIGDYTIMLVVEACENCFDTIEYNITVEEPPVADFTQDINAGCAVLDVEFTNQSAGTNLSYLWNFGNGEISTFSSPGIISFEQGNHDTTYYVSLAVTNGCGTVMYEDSVTVYPIPVVIFGTNVDDGCSPLEIEFSNVSVGNPESYEWYIDGFLTGTDSIFTNQIFTTSDTAISTYEVALIANNFCGADTLTNDIIVYPPNVNAFLSVDTTSGCEPLTVNFSNFSTPGASISWDFGDGNGSSEMDPIHTYDEPGIFTVVQYASNCGTDTDTITIEVLPAPEVSFTHVAYVCDGQPISFENTSIGINGSQWDFGDGNTSSLDSPTHTFNEPGNYTVVLTGFSNSNNCPASYQSEVAVLGNPDISFTPSTLDGCAPLSIDFTNTSIGANYYDWDFGNGEASTDENPQNQIFTDPGTYEVTLIGTDIFGCFSDTSVINIIVHEVPLSAFSTNGFEYCSGVDLIQPTNNSQGANQYYWTFGNGPVTEEFEPQQVIVDTGILEITLIAENGFGCLDTTLNTVQVLATPFAVTPNQIYEGCSPLDVQFSNDSEFSDQYLWIFGDGNNTSTESEPNHIYINSGNTSPENYMTTLIAMNSNGCPADTVDLEIQVNPNPVSNFSLSETEACGFSDTIFTQNTSVAATDYNWDFGDGNSSTLYEPFIVFSDIGMYHVSLMTANQYGCRDTFTQNLNILGQPNADIMGPDEGCQPATFNFINNSNYSDEFAWDFGDGNITTTILNPEHTYTLDGVYELILTASNSNGCPADSDTLEVLVHPKPISDFDLSEELICGLPDSILTTNLSQGASDYFWSFGNGFSSTLTEPLIIYQNPDEYTVRLEVSTEFGCRDTLQQTISANLQPEAEFLPSQYVGCEPDTVYFQNATLDADNWIWDFGDGTTSEEFSPVHVYPENGNYSVSLIASYNELCFDTVQIPGAVSILSSPIAEFSYEDMEDGKIQFVNESIDAINFEWDFGNGDFSDDFAPFYEYDANGNWQVILTATLLNGCEDRDTQSVMPDIFFGLYLPNAMSPESAEGDARVFKPAGIGIKSYTVQVYAPWGQLLWENSELEGEQPKGAWDGSWKGKIVPQGAYVWKSQVEFINGIKQVKTGTVSVLR